MLDRSYRQVLDESPDGVLIESHDRISHVNRAYARLLGYSDACDLASATVSDIAHAEEQDRLMFYGRRRQEGKPAPARYEFRANRRDGSVIRFDASVWLTRIGGDVHIATVVREVPQRPGYVPFRRGAGLLSR